MNWGWPQIVLAGLMAVGLGVDLARDGQPKTGKHSFCYGFFGSAVTVWLLYMGGFWS